MMVGVIECAPCCVAVRSFRLWKLKGDAMSNQKMCDDVAVRSFRLWKLKVENDVSGWLRIGSCSSFVPIVETEREMDWLMG